MIDFRVTLVWHWLIRVILMQREVPQGVSEPINALK